MNRRILGPAAGALLAGVFLASGQLSRWGDWLLLGVYFVLYPLYLLNPRLATSFASAYAIGLVVGRWVLHWYPSHWAWPEAVTLLALIGVPHLFQILRRKRQDEFDSVHGRRKSQYDDLARDTETLQKENHKIERQLQDIGHLYDVMREAGSTLNVQEMLTLAREHTEHMFNLPHFVMAMLSEDGKQYEIKVSSGCDDSQFKSLYVDADPTRLAARLAKERRTLWVEKLAEHPEYARLADLSIQSFVFIPFVVQNQVIGFFSSYSSGREHLNPEKYTNLQIFFNQISIGLQKALLYEKVQRLSITDGLTRLYSHRYFRQRLDEELILVKRYASPLTLLMLDIDHFKNYNDSYGHVAGDQVLMETAKILKEICDVTHFVARYGGEEMVVLAPEVAKAQGTELAERIRRGIENRVFKVGQESTRVTVSMGVAAYPQDAESAVELITQADKALYSAKEGGRNRVVEFHPGLRTFEKKIDTPEDQG